LATWTCLALAVSTGDFDVRSARLAFGAHVGKRKVMSAAGLALRAARGVLRRAGVDLRYTRDPRRRLTGVRVQWGEVGAGATPGAVAVASFEGMTVRFFVANENDEIQQEHLAGRFYEPEELAIIARHYDGSAFLDVGANVGNHTLYAAVVLKAPRVIAVEPNEAAAKILELNILLNALGERVEILRYGFSSRAATASIGFSPELNLGATRLVEGEGSIRLDAGDNLIREDVGFIKIDTEGFELDVLAGLAGTITRCRPTLFVEVESKNEDAFHRFAAEHAYQVAERFQRYETAVNYLMTPHA
jgi:FkbM family methyltransferase